MEIFKDYLICYNSLDTAPFRIALKNFLEIYSSQEVNIFKDFINLPGVAQKNANEFLKKYIFTNLFR